MILMERQSSIENEPRTLDVRQLEFAREAALYVVNTRSIEEASRIFTEGLQPVVRCAEKTSDDEAAAALEEEEEEEVVKTVSTTSHDHVGALREIVSAPF